MMKRIIAVNSNCYHGYSIEDAIDGIKAAGFKYIELTATKGWTEHVFSDMTFERLVQIKRRLDFAGLVSFAMSGHTNIMDAERIPDFVMNMDLAAFFGCQYIVTSVGEAHLKDKVKLGNDMVAQRLKELLPELKKRDLILALEVHGEHGSGEVLKNIADIVDSDRVVVNYDTANAIFYGNVDMPSDIDITMPRLGYMHLKDKAGEKKVWDFPALGEGYVDFPMVFKKLEEVGNNCPFSIEIEFTEKGPGDLDEVNRAVKTSYDYLISKGFAI